MITFVKSVTRRKIKLHTVVTLRQHISYSSNLEVSFHSQGFPRVIYPLSRLTMLSGSQRILFYWKNKVIDLESMGRTTVSSLQIKHLATVMMAKQNALQFLNFDLGSSNGQIGSGQQ